MHRKSPAATVTLFFLIDADLATSGIAHGQLEDLVNWWLRGTTTGMAKQIHFTRIWNDEEHSWEGYELEEAPAVQGTGELMGAVGAITAAVGHSLCPALKR